MPDPWPRIVILRALILLAAAIAIPLTSGCDGPTPKAPPLEHGRCEPAEYTRGIVSAKRCTYEGKAWHCQLAGDRKNMCNLLSCPRPAEAAPR